MLKHSKCSGGSIKVALVPPAAILVSEFILTQQGVRLSRGDLKFISPRGGEVKYFCTECLSTIPAKDVEGICFSCGRTRPVADLALSEYGEVYCLHHVPTNEKVTELFRVLNIINV